MVLRNKKEKNENDTMHNNNDDNNDSIKLTARSASIKHHTNQDCDENKTRKYKKINSPYV